MENQSDILAPYDLIILDTIANITNSKFILNLGMPTPQPTYATEWLTAIQKYITPSNIYAIEVGNELDHGIKQGWRSPPYTPQNYFSEFQSYADLVTQYFPNVPLMGPSYAYEWRDAGYQTTFYEKFNGLVKLMSFHRYALRGCSSLNTLDMLLDGTTLLKT
jgi:hypothetical protein